MKAGIDYAAADAKVAQVGPAAAIYLIALGTLYKFTNKYTPLIMLASGAVAGQFIFV